MDGYSGLKNVSRWRRNCEVIVRLVGKQLAVVALLLISGGVVSAELASSELPRFGANDIQINRVLERSETIYLPSYTEDETPYRFSDIGDTFTAALLPPLTLNDLQIYRRPKVKKIDVVGSLMGLEQADETKELVPVQGLMKESLQEVKTAEGQGSKPVEAEKAGVKQVSESSTVVWNEKLLSLVKDKDTWNSAGELAREYDSYKEEKEEVIEQFSTRGIHTGSTRGELLFSYGNPTAIWRTESGENHIFLYAVPFALTEEEARNGEKVFWTRGQHRAVENTARNSAYQAPAFESPMKGESYLGFTLEKDKVKNIQAFRTSDIINAHFPPMTGVLAVPNEMKDSDYSYQGYDLRTKLKPYEANDWQMTGKMQDRSVVQYRNALVVYDKDFNISHVISVNIDAVTRRGIAMGDNKYLMLFIYGKPTYLFKDVVESHLLNVEQSKVEYYVYKNPNMNHEYLVFAVGSEDGYIKQITLTNRVTEKVG